MSYYVENLYSDTPAGVQRLITQHGCTYPAILFHTSIEGQPGEPVGVFEFYEGRPFLKVFPSVGDAAFYPPCPEAPFRVLDRQVMTATLSVPEQYRETIGGERLYINLLELIVPGVVTPHDLAQTGTVLLPQADPVKADCQRMLAMLRQMESEGKLNEEVPPEDEELVWQMYSRIRARLLPVQPVGEVG